MHFAFPGRMCMYHSLSLSLSIYICKNGLDPDETRMEFRKECLVNLKKLCMQSVVQKPMRTIKWVFSISQLVYKLSGPMRGSRGGTGGPDPPPEKSQKHRISKQYWTRSPGILKTTKPAFNVWPSSARQRNAI